MTYQQNHIPQDDKSSPLHEIKPEAPAKLSHATYTTPAGAEAAPAPTSYFYDSRIEQHKQQQQQHPQQQQQQQLRPLTNSLSGGFVAEPVKLNKLRQKYTSPPQRSTTTTTITEGASVDPEVITTSMPRVTVSVSKSVTTSVRRVTSDGVTLVTPSAGNPVVQTLHKSREESGGESEKLQVNGWSSGYQIR